MKEKFKKLLQGLGLFDKFIANKLTVAEQKQISEKWKETFNTDFIAAMKDLQAEIATENQFATTMTAIASIFSEGGTETPPADPKAVTQAAQTIVEENARLREQNTVLGGVVVPPVPVEKVQRNATTHLNFILGRVPHSKTHLFGIEHKYYKRDTFYNKMFVERKVSESMIPTDEMNSFMEVFKDFSYSTFDRFKELSASNELAGMDFKQMLTNSTVDFSELEGTLGDFYRIRRQDLIIAYLRTLPSVTAIFPTHSGVSDQMALVRSFSNEFSQAFQEGEVFKGGFKIDAEIARVHDVMLKHQFGSMKKIESQYIGYLNTEGSQPIKWTFLEYLFIHVYTQLNNEFNQRALLGYRVEPSTGNTYSFLNASNGVITSLERFENEYKVLPIDLGGIYTPSTIVDYMTAFTEKLNQFGVLNADALGGRMSIYFNSLHAPWYLTNFRERFARDMDFDGVAYIIQDYNVRLVPVPNMGPNNFKVWATNFGNIELYTLEPGEMMRMYFERRLEALIVCAWWKEGSGAYMTGYKYNSLAELKAGDRQLQFIFTTDAATELEPDATTVDFKDNIWHRTVANTADTTITSIVNGQMGQVVRIICGSTTNASKITKSGAFDKITADWIPTAEGDYIHLVPEVIENTTNRKLEKTGKWLEVARKVS